MTDTSAPAAPAAAGELAHDPFELVAAAGVPTGGLHAALAETRRATPVLRHEVDPFDPNGPPSFTVYGYDDVVKVLREHDTFSSSIVTEFMGTSMGGDVMAGLDAPVHRRSRTLVSAGFAHRSLPLWTALIQDVINELMEQLARRTRADLVENFTLQFPAPVMAGIVGLPREDYPRFQAWAAEILSVAAGRGRAGVTASLLMRNYLAAKLAERRQEPRDDLISALAHAEVEGSRLSDREIFSFLRLLLSAGIETTYRSAGTLLFALLTHPDQLDAVRQDRSLLPRAIEEGLRWDPPVLFIRRRSTRDTRIGGVDVPAGSAVTLMLSSANRDERRWDRPDEFDVRREPQPNLAFGSGPHVCLGLHLARLEIQVAVSTLLDRYPNLRLDPDAEPPEIGGYVFRAPPALPVLLG